MFWDGCRRVPTMRSIGTVLSPSARRGAALAAGMNVVERGQELGLRSTAGRAGPSAPDPGGPRAADDGDEEEEA